MIDSFLDWVLFTIGGLFVTLFIIALCGYWAYQEWKRNLTSDQKLWLEAEKAWGTDKANLLVGKEHCPFEERNGNSELSGNNSLADYWDTHVSQRKTPVASNPDVVAITTNAGNEILIQRNTKYSVVDFTAYCQCPDCKEFASHFIDRFTKNEIIRKCVNVECGREWRQKK